MGIVLWLLLFLSVNLKLIFLFVRTPFIKILDVSLILARVARYAVLIPGNDLSEQEKLEIICGIIRNLINISILLDVDFESCVQAAWDEIKDRKGRMIDGVFVKEGDL